MGIIQSLHVVLIDQHTGKTVDLPPGVAHSVTITELHDNDGNFMRDTLPYGYRIEVTADFLNAFQSTKEPMRELQERPQIGAGE